MPTFQFDVAEPGGFTHPPASVASKDKKCDWPGAASRLAFEWDALSLRRLPEDPPAWVLGKARVDGKGPRRDVVVRPRVPRHNAVDPEPSESAIAELPPPLPSAGGAATNRSARGPAGGGASVSPTEGAPPPDPPATPEPSSAAAADGLDSKPRLRPACQVGRCNNYASCCVFASTAEGRHAGAAYWACKEHWHGQYSELEIRRGKPLLAEPEE